MPSTKHAAVSLLAHAAFVAAGWLLAPASAMARSAAMPPVDIGTRVEMFVDEYLIDPVSRRNVALEVQPPVRREVVLTFDKPWEGKVSGYFTVFQDGPRFRMYYRGSSAKKDNSQEQVTCYAESTDGIHFERPILRMHDIAGSSNNNVILKGVPAHNFAPFLDTNPAASPAQKYKALAGISNGLFVYGSPDGIHWEKMRSEPVMTKGTFDSLNLAFWDESIRSYRAYSRFFDGSNKKVFRSIQHSQSPDFLAWSEPEPNRYSEPPNTHFYTNATLPCPGAPHHYLAFPMRFMPGRQKVPDTSEPGVSDALLLTSRDGATWNRPTAGAWLRPGPDQHNWTDRSNMPAWGIVQTSPEEFSMYVSEHYRWPDNRLRRVTIRRHGFASMHAGANGGEFTTRPLTYSGEQLVLNYATSAAGSIRVEIQDENGSPIAGYALDDMAPLYGDELDRAVTWGKVTKLPDAFGGAAVRFRFVLHDADLFAIRTVKPAAE
jgi:hypothetical protein